MPRIARKYSQSNFYHVMVQGLNKESIFNTDFYIKKYLELILKKINRNEIEILTYCIMNNHAHFLIFCEKVDHLAKFMHKLNTSYSRFYNKVNQRVGFVFRDRYLSQDILDEKHLYCCVNYIHNNPVKAGIVRNPMEYKYSSCLEFFTKKIIITDNSVKLLFGSNTNYLEQLIQINNMKNDTSFIDIKKDIAEFVNDIEIKYQQKIHLLKENKNILKDVIKKAKKETNATILQLASLFEISTYFVDKYLKE